MSSCWSQGIHLAKDWSMLTGEHWYSRRLTMGEDNLIVFLSFVRWYVQFDQNSGKIAAWTWLSKHSLTVFWPSFDSLLPMQHSSATVHSPMRDVVRLYGSSIIFLPSPKTL